MTCRQLTSDEAHTLDLLVDALLTKGTLVTKPNLIPLIDAALPIFGDSFVALRRYVFEKTERILHKPVEGYNESGPSWPSRRPRLPFDADYDIVAEDKDVLAVYLNHAIYPDRDRPDTDMSIIVKEAMDVERKRNYIQWKKENHGRD